MFRTSLISTRSSVFTPDLVEGLRQANRRAAERGFGALTATGVRRTQVKTDAGLTGLPESLSLRRSGREVTLTLEVAGRASQESLEALWGLVIPLGFTPFDRYPLPSPTQGVFHFFGPWQRLYDSLLGEGRGEVAWKSVCAAAQVDVGTWGGGKTTERFVQAQLHRLGAPCGPVDGIIGPRTSSALRSLGLQGQPLTKAAVALGEIPESVSGKASRRWGYVVAPGVVRTIATGGVAAVQTAQGASLAIEGPGRLIVEIGG